MPPKVVAPTLLAACLFAAAAVAQDDPGEALDIPVAIGQEVKGIRMPYYDKDKAGKLSMRFNAEIAERANETSFNFKGLRIELFDKSPDKPDMEVFLNQAVFDRTTSMLTSKDQAKIKGEQYEIIGSQLEFDSKTRASRLLGPVTMTITDLGEQPAP